MSRASTRKRERQKLRHAKRPQQVESPAIVAGDPPIARVNTACLFGAILECSRAFDEALLETQSKA
jgi:hypothetical protein